MTTPSRAIASLIPALFAVSAYADTVQVTVDTSQTWLSYSTVYELPTEQGADRGAFVYGQFYYDGFYATPPGTLSGDVASLRPNSTLGASDTDTGNPFYSDWWAADGQGGVTAQKVIQDGFYVQDDSLAGNEVVFTGFTLTNTLVMPYSTGARAFIIDTFGPSYDFVSVQYVPLIAGQSFSVSLAVEAGHHVAYGIELVGPNAAPSAVAGLGVVAVSAVPEPAPALLLSAGLLGLMLRGRRA